MHQKLHSMARNMIGDRALTDRERQARYRTKLLGTRDTKLAAQAAALEQAAQWFEQVAELHLLAGDAVQATRNLDRAALCRGAAV